MNAEVRRKAISMIVPTRGRPQRMLRFLESLRSTVSEPGAIEIVMVVDEDDRESQRIGFAGLDLRTVVVPPGLSMGALNMAGYRASQGDHVMLMNDDVVVRSAAWDRRLLEVFESYGDGIVLVHVNDCIFEDKLCTFPLLSRRFCDLAGGICSERYLRYRIDDHIYNVFNLLALLGHRRIVYLPDVVFEHENTVFGKSGTGAYVPDPVIHGKDTVTFDELLGDRKQLAVRLVEAIDCHRRSRLGEVRHQLLAPVRDSVSLRRPEFVRFAGDQLRGSARVRVTVGVVSANLKNEHAARCIDLLKQHTKNFDLIVLDNNRGPNFNHSREMNRLLEICRTDYLVLMDDDVWVQEGWLDAMLECLDPETAVVTPMHMDREGWLSYAGVVMNLDGSGNHSHSCDLLERKTPIQTLCSAVMLIDLGKVGHLRLDETYSKYFLDIDYGLKVWEAGFKVVCSPSLCTHLGGATLTPGSAVSMELFEAQRRHWVREWVDSGRFDRLVRERWPHEEQFKALLDFPRLVQEFLDHPRGNERFEDYVDRAARALGWIEHIPALRIHLRRRVEEVCGGTLSGIRDPDRGHLRVLYAIASIPALVHRDASGRAIYMRGGSFFAVDVSSGVPGHNTLAALRGDPDRYANSLQELLDRNAGRRIRGARRPTGATGPRNRMLVMPRVSDFASGSEGAELIVHGFLFYNIIRTERYYGILQGDGPFDFVRLVNGGYRYLVSGDSLDEVKRAAVGTWLRRFPLVAAHVAPRIALGVFRRARRMARRLRPSALS